MDPISASVTKTCLSRAVLSKIIFHTSKFQNKKCLKLANRIKMTQFVNRTKKMPSHAIVPREYLRTYRNHEYNTLVLDKHMHLISWLLSSSTNF